MVEASELGLLLEEMRKLNRNIAALHRSTEDIRVKLIGGEPEFDDTVFFEPWFKKVDKALGHGAHTAIADLRAAAKEMDRRLRDAEVDIQAIRHYMQRGRRPDWIDDD